MKKKIAIDMDQVIADMEVSFVELVKKEYDLSFDTVEDYLKENPNFDLVSTIKELYPLINTYAFFRNIPVMKDSQKVLRELSEDYDLYIATAAMDVPKTFTAKYEWLQEHFDFIDSQHYIFCGDKSIVNTDYLIDDSIRQLDRFAGTGILFVNSQNKTEDRYVRASSWKEIREYFLSIKD